MKSTFLPIKTLNRVPHFLLVTLKGVHFCSRQSWLCLSTGTTPVKKEVTNVHKVYFGIGELVQQSK